MTDYLFHEHHGKPYPFRQGSDKSLYGVWYTRWVCSFSNCSQVVLLVKPEKHQKVQVGSNGLVSVYGFDLNEIIVDKKTGRRARIERFEDVMMWRRRDGRNTRVPSGEYSICYRWIEPDPRKPEGRIMDSLFSYERMAFFKRFRKQEEENG